MEVFKKDKKLWRKIQKGDEKSFAELYDLYVEKLYKFVFLKINNPAKAEEIVQDIFLKLWKLGQDEAKREVRNVLALLYKMARFAVIDYYRSTNAAKAKEIVSIDELAASQELEITVDIEQEEEMDQQYTLEQVKRALADLPEIYKDVVMMRFMDEMDYKEIAEVIGKEEGNVRVLVHRALKKLREILNSKKDESAAD